MAERLGLVFADGSTLIFPEGTDVQTAKLEAAEHDSGNTGSSTRVISVIFEILGDATDERSPADQ